FKYPLATVSKALDVLGDRLIFGYDVGCNLGGTITRSSLASRFAASKSCVCVDAFHGYTHNYACQDKNHPSVLEGTGLESFGVLERIFSQSNHLTPVIRYATAFNRRLYINLYFTQWDEDRYLNLGPSLYRSYVHTVKALDSDSAALSQAKVSLGITDDDLKTWTLEQSEYLRSVGQESEYDIHCVTYVELLQELRTAWEQSGRHKDAYMNSIPDNYTVPSSVTFATTSAPINDRDAAASQTLTLESAMRHAKERYNNLLSDVLALEEKMGISRRWQPSDEEYIRTVQYVSKRKYHRALNHLQRLVVLRLLELHKLNLGRAGGFLF
ncbi:hypothetical protein CONPUDRAFT_67056, partial [Coniophora puteana RWD-64-598 SS2]